MRRFVVIVLLLVCLGAAKANIVFPPLSEDEAYLHEVIESGMEEEYREALTSLSYVATEENLPLLIELIEIAESDVEGSRRRRVREALSELEGRDQTAGG